MRLREQPPQTTTFQGNLASLYLLAWSIPHWVITGSQPPPPLLFFNSLSRSPMQAVLSLPQHQGPLTAWYYR